MRITRRDGEWWIEEVPPYVVDETEHSSCGPYRTRKEAEDDKKGLEISFGRMDSNDQETLGTD
jgi:hypothetical protein